MTYAEALKQIKMLSVIRAECIRFKHKVKNKSFQVKIENAKTEETCAAKLFFVEGNFSFALVYEPGRVRHCLLEGLPASEAMSEATRFVESYEDVEKFLTRVPYVYTKQEHEKPRKNRRLPRRKSRR